MTDLIKMLEMYHDKIVRLKNEGEKEYYITNFKESIMEGVQEEEVVRDFFRIWSPVKKERNRRMAHNNTGKEPDFNIYGDSLFDWPMIIQSKLGGYWEQYNRLVAIQSPACVFYCWHCYVEEELKSARHDAMIQVTADQILDAFFEQKKYDKEENGLEDHVLRISGGEPLIMPELTLEILKKLKKMDKEKEVFVWIDTNLAPFLREEETNEPFIERWVSLDELASFRNFCIYPCLHGISPSNLEWITSIDPKYFDGLLNGLQILIEHEIDIYPTFGSNVSPPEEVPHIFQRLIKINENLPLRFGLIDYELFYSPVTRRIMNRSWPEQIYNKILVIGKWDKLLKQYYGFGYAEKPRWEVQLS